MLANQNRRPKLQMTAKKLNKMLDSLIVGFIWLQAAYEPAEQAFFCLLVFSDILHFLTS